MTAKAFQSSVILLGQREKEQSITWTRLRHPADKLQRKINQQDVPQCGVLGGGRGRKGQHEAIWCLLTSVKTERTDATPSC